MYNLANNITMTKTIIGVISLSYVAVLPLNY